MRALSRPIVAVAIAAGSVTASAADEDFTYARRLYLDKAQCSYCHGWAGDGAGEGQSNGGAANLRQTRLNRSQLVMTIMCGRPGTAMPHFDESAYTDRRCGATQADLGSRTPTLPPGSTLQPREAEAIADYVLAKFAGRGAPTRAECEESFGKDARACGDVPAKP